MDTPTTPDANPALQQEPDVPPISEVSEPVATTEVAAEPAATDSGPSWDDIRKRHPESADDLKRLESSLRTMHERRLQEERARQPAAPAATEQPAAPTIPTFVRRLMGVEEGDPYEGIDTPTEAPDFDEIVGDVPEEALADPAKMKATLAAITAKIYARAVEDADARHRKMGAEITKRMYAPIIEAQAKAELEAKGKSVAARLQESLPGMKDEGAFKSVLAEFNARGLKGEQAFRAVYTEMLPKNPDWLQPKAAPVPDASAAPAPAVVARPAPKPAPVDPNAAARAASMAALSGKRPSGSKASITIPSTLSTAESAAQFARHPEIRAAMAASADEGPSWRRVANAQKKMGGGA